MSAKLRKGFTMVELSLSLAFIGILSIIVLLIISNAVAAYHRGLTMNQLNTTGMDIVDDIRTTLQSSPARDPVNECAALYENPVSCQNDGARSLVYAERYENVRIGSETKNVPVYGVFCTGAYSYLWNSGYYRDNNEATFASKNEMSRLKLKYLVGDRNSAAETADNIRLLKVVDDDRRVCKQVATNNKEYMSSSVLRTQGFSITNGTIDITGYSLAERPIDILQSSNNLAVYSLASAVPAKGGASNNLLYSISLVLGTVQGGIDLRSTGNYCVAPEGYDSSVENFDYCAINKFNFAVQATGG